MNNTRFCVAFIVGVFFILFLCSEAAKKQFPYYDRPNYRYPYYDASGKGYLLYGYGGAQLYTYNKFTPLEGIYRR